jgi:hypothetical protein
MMLEGRRIEGVDGGSHLSLSGLFESPLEGDLVMMCLEATLPPRRRIAEIALITLDAVTMTVKGEWRSLVRVDNTDRLPQENLDKGAMRAARTFREVEPEVTGRIAGRAIMAYSGREFDFPVLFDHYDSIGVPRPAVLRCYDTLELFGSFPSSVMGEGRGLSDIARRFGLPSQEHTALSDCRLAIAVLKQALMAMFFSSVLSRRTDEEVLGLDVQGLSIRDPSHRLPVETTTATPPAFFGSSSPGMLTPFPIPTPPPPVCVGDAAAHHVPHPISSSANAAAALGIDASIPSPHCNIVAAEGEATNGKGPMPTTSTSSSSSCNDKHSIPNEWDNARIIGHAMQHGLTVRFCYQSIKRRENKLKGVPQTGLVVGWDDEKRGKFTFDMMDPSSIKGSRLLANVQGRVGVVRSSL